MSNKRAFHANQGEGFFPRGRNLGRKGVTGRDKKRAVTWEDGNVRVWRFHDQPWNEKPQYLRGGIVHPTKRKRGVARSRGRAFKNRRNANRCLGDSAKREPFLGGRVGGGKGRGRIN